MKTLIILGVVLALAGGFVIAYKGITYTTEEKVLDIGPFEARKETEKTFPLPNVLGIIALAGGVLMIGAGVWRGKNGGG